MHPLNLSLLPFRTKMYMQLMNREHLALLGCCAHVLQHAHLRRDYKRTTTNFLAEMKMAGQRGFGNNSRTRQRMPRYSAKHGAVAPGNHTQRTDCPTPGILRVSVQAAPTLMWVLQQSLGPPCLPAIPLVPTLKQAPQPFLPFVWAQWNQPAQRYTQPGSQRRA